jgi:hypothetical protein
MFTRGTEETGKLFFHQMYVIMIKYIPRITADELSFTAAALHPAKSAQPELYLTSLKKSSHDIHFLYL